jgi:hypothetical protein
MKTNWQGRLAAIRRLKATVISKGESDSKRPDHDDRDGIMAQEPYRDFTNLY